MIPLKGTNLSLPSQRGTDYACEPGMGIDITYCGTPSGFVYLVAIIDWYSRFIVGYAISNTMQSDFVVRAVRDAVQAHGTPEIMNSDQRQPVYVKGLYRLYQEL
jgi:transposase InsO family protein